MHPRSTNYALRCAEMWLSLNLSFIGALLSFLVSIVVVARRDALSPSIASLVLERVRPPRTLRCTREPWLVPWHPLHITASTCARRTHLAHGVYSPRVAYSLRRLPASC